MKLPLAAIWKKYKLVLLVAAVGVVLMLLPGGKQTQSAQAETDTRGTYSLEETERRMETLLGKISGTGQLSLMLTVQSGAELELAEDTDADERGQRRETVTLGRGSGTQDVVVTPGALPVLSGGGRRLRGRGRRGGAPCADGGRLGTDWAFGGQNIHRAVEIITGGTKR